MKPFEALLDKIRGRLNNLNSLKQAIFYLTNGTRLLPLFDKFCDKANLDNKLKMRKIVQDVWASLETKPSQEKAEHIKGDLLAMIPDDEGYMISELANAQWASVCVLEAMECHLTNKENISVFPCLVPMYQAVSEKIMAENEKKYGYKTFRNSAEEVELESKVISSPEFYREQEIIERYIEDLENDGRENHSLLQHWKTKAWNESVDPKDYA